MLRLLSPFAIGLLFGAGIVVSGMINPAKVVNFFDVFGAWDPSLAFVMIGGLTVSGIGYRLAMRRAAPVWDARFHLPTQERVDARLVGGAALFGLGWGISGFCPGAALPALGTGHPDVAVFVLALLVGVAATRIGLDRLAALKSAPAEG